MDYTRTQLYEQLKMLAPSLARGKSRARREELLALLEKKAAVEVGALAPPKPAPKPKKRKPKKKAESTAPQLLELSRNDVQVITRAVYLMGDAGNLMASSSIGLPGMASLLTLSTGVPVDDVLRVLEGLRMAPKDFGAA